MQIFLVKALELVILDDYIWPELLLYEENYFLICIVIEMTG